MRTPWRSLKLLRRRAIPAALAVLAWWASSAGAQPPQPLISGVFPAGGQRGKTVEATVLGTNLQGANGVRVAGQGVTAQVVKAEKPEMVRISVVIAPNAELGERDLRVLTPGGVASRCRFQIGELNEVSEVEPNSEKGQAQRLESLPVVVSGQILENDRDYFRFAAKAGQTLVFAVQARSLLPFIPDAVPGFLDACLTLYDADGKELSWIDDYRLGPDPVMVYVVPKDGEYVLELRDVVYRGRPTFVYRLAIGVLPCVTSIYPLGGQRNTTVQVQTRGVNLPAANIGLAIPGDSPALRLVGFTGQSPASNVLPFAVGDVPEVAETEPNDSQAQANRLAVPAIVNGRIQRSGDNDYFIFPAQAGQALVMEVQARRLGSPLDSILYLYNDKGQELARNDDWVDPADPLLLYHADSRLAYTFPAAGDYMLRIKDIQQNGGEEYAYRLLIAPPRPDFALRTSPDNPRLGKGDTAILTVTAVRKDGFAGEIQLAAQNLAPGFAASAAAIPAGQDTTRLTISAPADAPLGVVTPTIVGTGTVGKDPVVRTVQPCEEVMQAFSIKHIVPTQELALAVIEPVLLTLSTSVPPAKVTDVQQGAEVAVTVKAARLGGAQGVVTLAIDGAPAWLTLKPSPAAIPADKSEMAITLSVAKQAPVGLLQSVVVTGTLNTGKETATRFAPAIPLKILAAPPP